MGMLDYFYVDGEEHQTKSLDCSLHKYRVTDDGRLEINRFDHDKEWTELQAFAEDGTVPEEPESDWTDEWKPCDYSGEVYYYGDDGDHVMVFVRGKAHWTGHGQVTTFGRVTKQLRGLLARGNLDATDEATVKDVLGLLGEEVDGLG